MWLSQQAADLHPEPGEYLIHEGEPTPFFVVMEGTTEVLKDVMGRQTEVSEHNPGDFFGELAILMATAAPAGARSLLQNGSRKSGSWSWNNHRTARSVPAACRLSL